MLHGQVEYREEYIVEYVAKISVPQEAMVIITKGKNETQAVDRMVRGLRKIGVTDKIRLYSSVHGDMYTF